MSAGVVAERAELPDRLARRFDFEQRLAAAGHALGLRAGDTQRATWRQVDLNQHTIEWAAIRVHAPGVRGGALAVLGGNLVFSSPLGRFGYLGADNVLRPLPLQAPTNVAAIRGTPLSEDPLFMAAEFRVHDLLARARGENSWELYASLSRFERAGCYQFKIVRARLEQANDGLHVTSGWEDVFTARPGCIPDKDHGWRFQGTEAGGRMVLTDDNTMLVSVGDHQFDGYNSSQRAAMDPNWDLGKIIQIDLRSLETRIYTSGMRNPQGLVVMRDGRIFSTEHGPQGGDEINFIRRGANYGWPLVSYGVNYGFPRSVWPTDPHPGGHSGYTRPAFAFVPAIGINNLVQPDPREFPNWSDNDLFLISLRAGTLFHVATYEDHIAYVEPIELNRRFLGRERLRDIVTLADGRNAILTDSGRIIFVRNADLHTDAPRSFVVRGYSSLTRPMPEEMFADGGSRIEQGRQYFQISCASCHSLTGEIGNGPPLNGILGRHIAGVDGFSYSQALAHTHGVWTENALRSFMIDPSDYIPGSAMPSPGISWAMAPEIVDYLRTTTPSGAAEDRTQH
ncbi:MAG: PQQ-dependent sugar dehydrogenase [Hyphomonadaceae bacterium]|nr:PQQ-dependent sugar dehydrogenase [Hyphomonadaceae bacterium]